jgi:hypothetical protein
MLLGSDIEVGGLITMLFSTCVVYYTMRAPDISPKRIEPLTASTETDARSQR